MKFLRIMILVMLGFVLFACEESDGTSVRLYDEYGKIYETYKDRAEGETIDLPFFEREDRVFVGWSDGEQIHYPTYVVRGKRELTVVFEDPEEVFDYKVDVAWDQVSIRGYSGDASYLRIPATIDGRQVSSIYVKAFEGLSLVSVDIPDTAQHVQTLAFSDMPNLQSVSFYSGDITYVWGELMQEEFDALIADNQDACKIETNESSTSWTYEEGCPIHAVTSFESVYTVEGNPYNRYFVTFDLRFYESYDPDLMIIDDAFSGLESLESVLLPGTYHRFRPLIFEDTPNLKTVGFAEDSRHYTIIDGVIYTRDLKQLVYYPQYLSAETFFIPESVETILSYAFKDNTHLVTIHVGATMDSIDPVAFMGLTSLEAIHVDAANDTYYSDEGVLYGIISGVDCLVKYPAARPGSSYVVFDGITNLYPQSFSDNLYLTEVVLPEGLRSISREAFAYSKSLQLLEIPRRVEHMDYLVFYESALEAVLIRRSIVEDGGITTAQFGTARGGLPFFYVPDDSFDDYESNPFWEPYSDYLRPFSSYEPD
jgi:hypothetical protein